MCCSTGKDLTLCLIVSLRKKSAHGQHDTSIAIYVLLIGNGSLVSVPCICAVKCQMLDVRITIDIRKIIFQNNSIKNQSQPYYKVVCLCNGFPKMKITAEPFYLCKQVLFRILLLLLLSKQYNLLQCTIYFVPESEPFQNHLQCGKIF